MSVTWKRMQEGKTMITKKEVIFQQTKSQAQAGGNGKKQGTMLFFHNGILIDI